MVKQAPYWVKREAGAIPERSRHCKGESFSILATDLCWEGGKAQRT